MGGWRAAGLVVLYALDVFAAKPKLRKVATQGATHPPTVTFLAPPGGSNTATEDTEFTVFGPVAITDPDAHPNWGGITVNITTREGGTVQVWRHHDPLELSGDGTSFVSLKGRLSDIEYALANLKYKGPTDFAGIDVIRVSMDDGYDNKATGSTAIVVVDQNDPPVLTGNPQNISMFDDEVYWLGFHITDVDAQNLDESITIVINVTEGTLSWNSTFGGLTSEIFPAKYLVNADDRPTVKQLTAPVPVLNDVLTRLKFTPPTEFYGRIPMHVILNDHGHHGRGSHNGYFGPPLTALTTGDYASLPTKTFATRRAINNAQFSKSTLSNLDWWGGEFTLRPGAGPKIVRRVCVMTPDGGTGAKFMPSVVLSAVSSTPGFVMESQYLDPEAQPYDAEGNQFDVCFSYRGMNPTTNPSDPESLYDGLYVEDGGSVDFRFMALDPTTGGWLSTTMTGIHAPDEPDIPNDGTGAYAYLYPDDSAGPFSKFRVCTFSTRWNDVGVDPSTSDPLKVGTKPVGVENVLQLSICSTSTLEEVPLIYVETLLRNDLAEEITQYDIPLDVISRQDAPYTNMTWHPTIVTDEDTSVAVAIHVHDDDAGLLWELNQVGSLTAKVSSAYRGWFQFWPPSIHTTVTKTSGKYEWTVTGPYAEVQRTLLGSRYTPAADWSGTDYITVYLNDHGGSEREQTAEHVLESTAMFNITVNPVADTARLVGGSPRKFFIRRNQTLHLSHISIEDVDTPAAVGTYEVALNVSYGALNILSPALSGVTVVSHTPTAVVFTGTFAQVNLALSGLTYTHTVCDNPHTSPLDCPLYRVDDMRDFEDQIVVTIKETTPLHEAAAASFYITIAAVADYYKTCGDFVASHAEYCGCYYQTGSPIQMQTVNMTSYLSWTMVPMDYTMATFLRHTPGEQRGYVAGCCATFSDLERPFMLNLTNEVGACSLESLATDWRLQQGTMM